MMSGTPVAAALRELMARFESAGINEARLSARRLVRAATGLSNEEMALQPGRKLTEPEALRLDAYVARRLVHEPITRIEGWREFYGRPFLVTPETLDPRPDTEVLVELALEVCSEIAGRHRTPLMIVDVGTGTGCILLTLIAELKARGIESVGIGVDICKGTLDVAEQNARWLGMATEVSWLLTDGRLAGLPVPDLLVSNPPYIPASDIPGLEPEVRDYDPRRALDGGSDGLQVIRDIVGWSAEHPSASVAIEFGSGQKEDVLRLLGALCGNGTASTSRFRTDLGGHTRCVAWKPR